MQKQRYDLRDLILMIKEHKQIDPQLTLEFDCYIETEDVTTLIKVINYAINYIKQVSEEQLHISLIAGMRGFKISFMAMTELAEFPPLNTKVGEALVAFDAVIDQIGEPGKFAQLVIKFSKEVDQV